MAITQQNLANILGVSTMTVSRALRNQPGVSATLRRKIQAAAAERGYIPDAQFAARVLRQKGNGHACAADVFCIMIHDPHEKGHMNARLIKGACDEAESLSLEIVVAPRPMPGNQLPRVVLRRQVDGVIRLLGDIEILKGYQDPPMPWVSILYEVADKDVVTVDTFAACRELGRRLASLGHRRVAFVGTESPLSRERIAGLRAGLREHGADMPENAIFLRRFVMDAKTTQGLLADMEKSEPNTPLPRRFTAMAVYNDYMAATVVRYLQNRGVRVPEDMSVTGFDGALPEILGEKEPLLATIAIPFEEMGREAVRLLAWRLRNPEAPRRRVLIETKLVEGATCAPPAGEARAL